MRSRLKMRHILLLAAIDEHRSIHKAAASMNTSQPAATKLLSDLEELLGLHLFERSTRGPVPTPHGESLVRHARTILGTLDHARGELDAISDGAAGKIRIGMLLVVASVLVPRALLRFKRSHPTMTVLVQEGTLATLLPALHRGDIDLVVGRLTADFDSTGLHFEFCYEEPMRVVVRAGHPLSVNPVSRLSELAGETWVLPPPDAAFRQRIDAAFRQQGVEPPSRLVESMSIVTNKALLEGSDMLGVMPRNVARNFELAGDLAMLAVDLPPPSGPVGIITRSETSATDAQRELFDALRTVAHEIAGA